MTKTEFLLLALAALPGIELLYRLWKKYKERVSKLKEMILPVKKPVLLEAFSSIYKMFQLRKAWPRFFKLLNILLIKFHPTLRKIVKHVQDKNNV